MTCLALQSLIRDVSLGYTVPPESEPARLQPPVHHLETPPRLGVAAQKIDFPARRPNHICVPVTFEARGACSDVAELAAKTLVLKGRRGPEVGSL